MAAFTWRSVDTCTKTATVQTSGTSRPAQPSLISWLFALLNPAHTTRGGLPLACRCFCFLSQQSLPFFTLRTPKRCAAASLLERLQSTVCSRFTVADPCGLPLHDSCLNNRSPGPLRCSGSGQFPRLLSQNDTSLSLIGARRLISIAYVSRNTPGGRVRLPSRHAEHQGTSTNITQKFYCNRGQGSSFLCSTAAVAKNTSTRYVGWNVVIL